MGSSPSAPPAFDLISIGDANVDMLMFVPQHPDLKGKGELGTGIRGDAYHIGPGGMAANLAAGTAKLGNRVGFISVIGDDDLGGMFRRRMTELGIDLRYLRILPDHATSLACVFEQHDGETIFYVCPGSRYIPPEYLPAAYLTAARLLFLPGHMLTQDEVTGQALLDAIDTARRHGVLITVDPGKYWLNPALESYVHRVIAMTDILLPNMNEAKVMTGCDEPSDAGRALLQEGAHLVVIKQDKAGCTVCSENEDVEVPAFETHIGSTLGAGDAFNSGFLHGYLRGWPLRRTARFANAVAALKIPHVGTQTGLPTEAEVEAFLTEHL